MEGFFVSRSRFSPVEKMKFINDFQQSNNSLGIFARNIGISSKTLKRWIILFEREGVDGLEELTKRNSYPVELKLKVVKELLDGNLTAGELVKKYKLRSHSQVYDWVFKYNNGKQLTSGYSSRKCDSIMTRKTTFEERIEVVEYVVKSNHSYSEAAEHFSVTYQQARSWVLKSQNGGYETLLDGRGHRKAKDELTDLDKANLKIRQLESQLREQKIIEEFSKKFRELQRRG
jgi:Transposase and inactivated derivatives